VPVSLGSAKPPLGFRQFQTVDLGGWNGEGRPAAMDELIEAIARTCGTEAEPGRTGPAEKAGAPRKRTSICVLPFINMSGEAEQEYFSDGISEDIITDLSKVSALSIVARNTAFTFKGQSVDVKEVAKTLGVTYVLEGSVRKAGNRVRITAQLIDGAAGDHVWADRYDRDLTDIFEIQDEISKAIVEALKIKLLPEEKKAIESRGTNNVEAYNLYLMARQQWVSGNFGDPRRDEAIVRVCKQATRLDPDYAQAWALMALAQAELRFVHGKDENAAPAADRALELNADLPEAHCIKARYLEEEGKADEAEKQIRTALKLNPDSWEVNREAARMLFRRGRTEDAIPFFKKAASQMETDWHNPLMLTTCYGSIGDKAGLRDAAKMVVERAERAVAKEATNGQALAAGANALIILGDEERGLDWSRRARLLDPDNLIMCYNLACALATRVGNVPDAIDALEPFLEGVKTAQNIRHLEADPDLDPLRGDPRYEELLASAKQRLGMTDAAKNG
jgi:adenylate cyclase